MDQTKIQEVLKNEIVDRHSFFQLKYFIVGKEPTTQAKMWRCLRELDSRKQSIEAIYLELDDINDQKEMLELEVQDTVEAQYGNPSQSMKKKLEIQIRQKKRRINALDTTVVTLKKKLKYTEEEAEFFYQAFKSLEKVEKLLPFDDLKSQEEYWNEKLGEELNLKALLRQPIDVDLVKTIFALSENLPVRKIMVKIIEDTRQALAKKGEDVKCLEGLKMTDKGNK